MTTFYSAANPICGTENCTFSWICTPYVLIVIAYCRQRTVTRGVNKGVKEDFKVTMEKQVCRSHENVETIIRQFLVEEKDLITQNLS